MNSSTGRRAPDQAGYRMYNGSFIDGNIASQRQLAGQYAAAADWSSTISKLKTDTKTHKIIEKIEIYTHSRGAAFGAGYITELITLIGQHPELFRRSAERDRPGIESGLSPIGVDH